jgi:hypothetical protein
VHREFFPEHIAKGTGPFGEEVEDYVHGKKWVDGAEALNQATVDCWDIGIHNKAHTGGKFAKYDCDVHGRFDISACSEPK